MNYSIKQIDYLGAWLLEKMKLLPFEGISEASGVTVNTILNICYRQYEKVNDNDLEAIISLLNSISFIFPDDLLNINSIICDEVGRKYNASICDDDLKSKSRKREIVFARQLCMCYRYKVLGNSLKNAAKPYIKDHATVINAVKSVRNMLETDKLYREMVERIENRTSQEIIKKILK